MSTIRAFIGIKVSTEIQDKLEGIQKKLKKADAHVSWINPDNIHLTLQFLGNIDEAQIPDIETQLRESVSLVNSFQLQVGYAGAFPNLRYPRVIWIGVSDDEENSLKTIQAEIGRRLSALGFQQEEGLFKPHLTIGRVRSQKNKSNLLRAVEAIVNIWVGEIVVDAIYVIKSELRPTGAEYTDLVEVTL